MRGGCRVPTAWSARCGGGSSVRVGTFRAGCSRRCAPTAAALVVANVQPQSVLPYLAAARRLGPARRRVRRELGPHGRQGSHLALLRPVRRPERGHGERISAATTASTEVGSSSPAGRRRTSSSAPAHGPEYDALLRSYGLDPVRPLVLVMGNTPTNAPYEGHFVERLLSWWEEGSSERFQLLFRPHPRDRDWAARFALGSWPSRRPSPGAELHGSGGARRASPAR